LKKIKDMLRAITTTIIGVILGMMGMMAMHYLSMVFYPLPEGITMEDTEALNKYMEIAPLGAMILVIVSHAMGSFIGALSATLLSQVSKWKNSIPFQYQFLIIGLIFTYAGWLNLESLTHPDWFKIDLLFYLPAAYFGYKLVAKRA
jgi:uncharacterized protein YacL